jgi:hypothetical protein
MSEPTETLSFIDPFWLEQGEKIRRMRETIKAPKTLAGEELCQESQDYPLFRTYDRFRDIYSFLIVLFEYEEIGKKMGENYFADPTNQRIVLRAFGLGIEDIIKAPYNHEEKSYEGYQGFFNLMRGKLQKLDTQIVNGICFPHFLNSLGMAFNQTLQESQGIKEYVVKGDDIKERIGKYVTELAGGANDDIVASIGEQLEFL